MTYSTHLLRHFRKILGQNIHLLRSKKKVTLYKLAQITGIPETKIDHYELGKNEIPFDHALKIACALETDFVALLK